METLPAININFNESVEDNGAMYYSSTLVRLKKDLNILEKYPIKNKDEIAVKKQLLQEELDRMKKI